MIRVLRRALPLLGVLAGLFAMHGLAPGGSTGALAAGPQPRPAALLTAAGMHGLTSTPTDVTPAAASDPAVTDGGAAVQAALDATAMPDLPGMAVPAQAAMASSGSPSPGHGGHGSHVDGQCLAVLTSGIVLFLALAVLSVVGRPGSRARTDAPLGRLGRLLAAALPRRSPDLSRLCVLRI